MKTRSSRRISAEKLKELINSDKVVLCEDINPQEKHASSDDGDYVSIGILNNLDVDSNDLDDHKEEVSEDDKKNSEAEDDSLKPFQCNFCGKKFQFSKNLIAHGRFHTKSHEKDREWKRKPKKLTTILNHRCHIKKENKLPDLHHLFLWLLEIKTVIFENLL